MPRSSGSTARRVPSSATASACIRCTRSPSSPARSTTSTPRCARAPARCGSAHRHHDHRRTAGPHHSPGTRGSRRRRAAVLIGSGDVEPARAVGRSSAGRSRRRWMGGDRQGGGGQRQAHRGGRCGRDARRSRSRSRQHRESPRCARDGGRARTAVGFGGAQWRCDGRTAREQPARAGDRYSPMFRSIAEPAEEYWAARSARPWR